MLLVKNSPTVSFSDFELALLIEREEVVSKLGKIASERNFDEFSTKGSDEKVLLDCLPLTLDSTEKTLSNLRANHLKDKGDHDMDVKRTQKLMQELRPTGVNRKIPYAMEAGSLNDK